MLVASRLWSALWPNPPQTAERTPKATANATKPANTSAPAQAPAQQRELPSITLAEIVENARLKRPFDVLVADCTECADLVELLSMLIEPGQPAAEVSHR